MIFRRKEGIANQIACDWARDNNLNLNAFMGDSRKREFVFPRQDCMARIRRETGLSYPDIGRLFGRDHTTVIHSIKRSEERNMA